MRIRRRLRGKREEGEEDERWGRETRERNARGRGGGEWGFRSQDSRSPEILSVSAVGLMSPFSFSSTL